MALLVGRAAVQIGSSQEQPGSWQPFVSGLGGGKLGYVCAAPSPGNQHPAKDAARMPIIRIVVAILTCRMLAIPGSSAALTYLPIPDRVPLHSQFRFMVSPPMIVVLLPVNW